MKNRHGSATSEIRQTAIVDEIKSGKSLLYSLKFWKKEENFVEKAGPMYRQCSQREPKRASGMISTRPVTEETKIEW